MKWVTKQGWREIDPAAPIEVTSVAVMLRCEEFASVLLAQDDGQTVLIGQGQGELELVADLEGTVEIVTKGRVWAFEAARQQFRPKTSDHIFTSLDRPSPLSPEMYAIQRMMRLNEINREKDRVMMRQMMDERDAKSRDVIDTDDSEPSPDGKTAPKKTDGDKAKRGETDAKQSESDADQKSSDASRVSESADTSDKTGAKSNDASGKGKNTSDR